MTTSGDPPRRFSEDEVAPILRRAAEMEARSDLPAPRDPTLEDLVAAAREAGLDPDEVRRSAALEPAAEGGAARTIFGAPDRRTLRAFLPLATLPENRQALVRAVESSAGLSGTVLDSAPGLFRWEERHLGGGTRVELTAAPDGVELRVASDRAGSYLGLWFGAFVLWAAASALTPLHAVGLPALLLGMLVAPLLLARPFWARSDATARARLERLAMDLLRAVDEGA